MADLDALRANITAAVLHTPGDLDAAQRLLLHAYARDPAHASAPDAGLKPFVDKLLTHAYKIVDADIAALRALGYSEDAIYEVIVTCAAGAGMRRIASGLAAL
jgi:alkylhydroperoxidase family enzyme